MSGERCEHQYAPDPGYDEWLTCGKCRDIVTTERMLADLLGAEELFCNTGEFNGEKTVVLFLQCNDVFAWACSDAENIVPGDVKDIWLEWKKHPKWGTARWCAVKRNQKPQPPVIAAMKTDGAWDERMERLGENTQDEETQAMFRAAASANRHTVAVEKLEERP